MKSLLYCLYQNVGINNIINLGLLRGVLGGFTTFPSRVLGSIPDGSFGFSDDHFSLLKRLYSDLKFKLNV